MAIQKLPHHLWTPYEQISKFIENVPFGITFEQITSKIGAVKRLKPKEQATLLQYIREKDRIDVIETTAAKGVPGSPILRHAKYNGTKPDYTADVPHDSLGRELWEARDNKGATTTLGSYNHLNLSTTKQDDKVVIDVTKTDTGPDTTGLELPPVVEEKAPDAKCKFTPESSLPAHLVAPYKDIITFLENKPNGATLTEVNLGVTSYHRLNGGNRTVVQNALRNYAGIKFSKSTVPARGMIPTVLLHSKYVPDNEIPSGDTLNPTTMKSPVALTTKMDIEDHIELATAIANSDTMTADWRITTTKPADTPVVGDFLAIPKPEPTGRSNIHNAIGSAEGGARLVMIPQEATNASLALIQDGPLSDSEYHVHKAYLQAHHNTPTTDTYKEPTMSLAARTPAQLREEANALIAAADQLERENSGKLLATFEAQLAPLQADVTAALELVDDLYTQQTAAMDVLRAAVAKVQNFKAGLPEGN